MPAKLQIQAAYGGGRVACVAPAANQRGVALAIVVWFIAGMSLLVAGIVSHARVDTQMAQLHVARAKAVAAGDGAIHLMMADRVVNEDLVADGLGNAASVYRLGDSEVAVRLYPAQGLVDLNSATEEVLAALFSIVGKVPGGEADYLAGNVIKWRGSSGASQKKKAALNRFHAIEDLLRVEGISRTLLDSLRDYIVAGQSGAGDIDWAMASEGLLRVLEATNSTQLEAVYRRREQLFSGASQSMSGTYRADALVHYGDKTWLRRRWVSMESAPGSELPWRVVRTEPPRVYEISNGSR